MIQPLPTGPALPDLRSLPRDLRGRLRTDPENGQQISLTLRGNTERYRKTLLGYGGLHCRDGRGRPKGSTCWTFEGQHVVFSLVSTLARIADGQRERTVGTLRRAVAAIVHATPHSALGQARQIIYLTVPAVLCGYADFLHVATDQHGRSVYLLRAGHYFLDPAEAPVYRVAVDTAGRIVQVVARADRDRAYLDAQLEAILQQSPREEYLTYRHQQKSIPGLTDPFLIDAFFGAEHERYDFRRGQTEFGEGDAAPMGGVLVPGNLYMRWEASNRALAEVPRAHRQSVRALKVRIDAFFASQIPAARAGAVARLLARAERQQVVADLAELEEDERAARLAENRARLEEITRQVAASPELYGEGSDGLVCCLGSMDEYAQGGGVLAGTNGVLVYHSKATDLERTYADGQVIYVGRALHDLELQREAFRLAGVNDAPRFSDWSASLVQ